MGGNQLSFGENMPGSSLLHRGSSVHYINPLCEVYRRPKVEWIDQAENLCQMPDKAAA